MFWGVFNLEFFPESSIWLSQLLYFIFSFQESLDQSSGITGDCQFLLHTFIYTIALLLISLCLDLVQKKLKRQVPQNIR